MKKIILTLFLLTFSLSFSNSDIDIISKELWRCPYSVDKTFKGLTYVKFLNENGKPSITFSVLDNRAALKTGTVTLELSQLDYEVKEDEKSIYFINLNEKTKDFSNYRLSYSFDKKNRPKMDLYRISDNKKLCSLVAN
ncbi:hypothetical protein HMPREF1984_01816 [Leptotrichia sp. oral taxon 215 str. W9775]|uniref:hypothetical protein n=1 Tax=Leptotrichia sp. oral taxon 215 TaxID=712359 RepID=UPI0003ADA7D5|nr:hypothetical protein [Leptotrichia sp. oral taxon 215]ERK66112.1 hypothetical protein HMPREF1984_01816 [Leptotrichia sp. oral taxon 215 str. W9775]